MTTNAGLPPEQEPALREILGYLNFSSGKPDASFARNLNDVLGWFLENHRWEEWPSWLRDSLQVVQQEGAAFADVSQAEAVISLVFEETLPAYRRHHGDLLFHLNEEEFRHPFFLARVFEAVLAAGGPWDERDRIVEASLDSLNDFLGYRPLPVLENGRKMEPYEHERHRPVPLYIREAGIGCGRYHDLIARTLEFLQETPSEILESAYYDFALMDELALDMRAYDHTHPVNKRTNYMFGEWDPHCIDAEGRYRRFVVRRVILEAMLNWIEQNASELPYEECLHDAAAVLCGTMLMASAISGSGPATHDSSVTLSSLLPKVARQRDAFYERLLQEATGERARRLNHEAEQTRQPFGHVRHALNMHLAEYGARQVQRRQVAQFFARMGYREAAREEATVIPSVSARFECELQWRLTSAALNLDQGEVNEAAELLGEVEDHLHRGIACGAFVDPWNILAFQGQFPLFSAREDSVPDHRIETLLDLMEQTFGVYSRAVGEAAAAGQDELTEALSHRFGELAEWWDRFATDAVEDLPNINGRDSWESARHVADALAEWQAAGESAGDISFWRQHVERFTSAKAYALVVNALLQKQDHVAAMGLLMQWLSQAEEVGLESGPHSIHALLPEWMRLVTEIEASETESPETESPETESSETDLFSTVRRLFDFLEANAGDYWDVPDLQSILGGQGPSSSGEALAGTDDAWFDDFGDEADADEDDLFDAAYEGVIYRDSAADGYTGETLDDGYNPAGTEFEIINRKLDPRLKFLNTLGQLWQMAAVTLASRQAGGIAVGSDNQEEWQDVLRDWHRRASQLSQGLARLAGAVWDYEISTRTGDQDANIEYDIQFQTKQYLLHTIAATSVTCKNAERMLLCCLPPSTEEEQRSDDQQQIVAVYRAIFQRDPAEVRRLLPGLLRRLARRPLLYVPLDSGGHPKQMLAVRNLQTVMRFFLSELPRLGLLHETRHVLRTAFRMERAHRPGGLAVTEFDKLFRTALESTLEVIVTSSADWDEGEFADEDLIDVVGEIVERYLDQWLKHSNTMQLSNVEALKNETVAAEVRDFIKTYGADLFHARMLTLGNVRTILQNGIEAFLDYLAENPDPLRPVALIEDLEQGRVDRETVVDNLHLIYSCLVDKFERFLEYNTTTTHSDYGEMFYCLLDFLRIEAAYDREAWNLTPVSIAHEVLARHGKTEASMIWEKVFESKTEDMADQHLEELHELEESYGMRLPSVRDHLNERFVKPLAVNRMVALVPQAARDARSKTGETSEAFETLREEIHEYLENVSGSGIDVPPWLRSLEKELDRTHAADESPGPQSRVRLPTVRLSLQEVERQLEIWDEPLRKKRRDDD